MQTKTKELLKIHRFKIFENSKAVKGQWATYLPDPTKPNGRRLLRRNSYSSLCDAIIDYYYGDKKPGITLQVLFEKWIVFRRNETSVKSGTIRKDVSAWRTHIRNMCIDNTLMNDYLVTDVTARLLYRYFRIITKDRRYSRQAICNIRGVLSGMLSYAIELGIIDHNPAKEIDLKRLPYKPKKISRDQVYSEEDAHTLLKYLEDVNELYALAIRLDFNLFIRIGELAGLKWENVDLQNRMVYICHQVTYEPELKDDLTFSEKKMVTEDYIKGYTTQGFRYEYLTDEALEILNKARKINPDGEYVFMPNGRPMVTLTFNKRLKRYCELAGVTYHSSHKIRSYAASAAFDGRNLPQISKMMGHSQISTTMRYLRDINQEDTYPEVFKNLGRRK